MRSCRPQIHLPQIHTSHFCESRLRYRKAGGTRTHVRPREPTSPSDHDAMSCKTAMSLSREVLDKCLSISMNACSSLAPVDNSHLSSKGPHSQQNTGSEYAHTSMLPACSRGQESSGLTAWDTILLSFLPNPDER